MRALPHTPGPPPADHLPFAPAAGTLDPVARAFEGFARGRPERRGDRGVGAGLPFAFAEGPWEAAADAGDVDVIEAVVGAHQARLGAEEDVVTGGVGVQEERPRGTLARGDQVHAAASGVRERRLLRRAGSFAELLPLIDVPGTVGVLGDERLVAFEEDPRAVIGDHARGVTKRFPSLETGGSEDPFVDRPSRGARAGRVAGDAVELAHSRVVAVDLRRRFA